MDYMIFRQPYLHLLVSNVAFKVGLLLMCFPFKFVLDMATER